MPIFRAKKKQKMWFMFFGAALAFSNIRMEQNSFYDDPLYEYDGLPADYVDNLSEYGYGEWFDTCLRVSGAKQDGISGD